MAEQFVSKDQFEEFTKRMEQGFHHADQRHNDLLAVMNQRFDQVDQRHKDLLRTLDQRFTESDQRFAQVDQRFAQVDQRFTELRQDIRTLNTAVQRQMWALIAVVLGGAIKVLFFS